MSGAAVAHTCGAGLLIPGELAAEVAAELGVEPLDGMALGGGCISPAWRIRLRDGGSIFVKQAPAGAGRDLLEAEAESLRSLLAAEAVRVPGVLGMGGRWLALEWLEPGPANEAAWRTLGRALAALHRSRGPSHGWHRDNYIGTLAQANGVAGSWAAFWRDRRLRPQLALAREQLRPETLSRFDRLLGSLDDRLAAGEEDGPSLLHGDLWSGNVHMAVDGPALIDPSSYHGHREVDLAMADLFGGFPRVFQEAYTEAWPLQAGWAARRPIYQLYYLLVHVNLFGAAYVARTESALHAALG